MAGSARHRNRLGLLTLDLNDRAALGGEPTGVPVSDTEPMRATYGLFLPNVVPAANPTDLILIKGSANKRVRVKGVTLAGTATSASNIIVNMVKRTADNTAGTRTVQTLVPRDSQDDAPQATVYLYTANASGLGASAGTVDGGRLNLAPAANGSIDRLAITYSWQNDKAVVLNGASEFLALNLGGVAWPAGGALDVFVMLQEEDL